MSVVDTFYFLFKSNAKEAAAEVDKLDVQISTLASKGKKRTEEETKQLKELRKQRNEATQDLRDQNKVTDNLGDSLLGLGLKALTAYASFEAIKSTIKDTQDFNLSLQKTRALTGQNAEEVEAWDKAFQNLGASQGAFKESFINISQALIALGQNPDNIFPWFKALSEELRALPEAQARQRFSQIARTNNLSPELFNPLYSGKLAKAIDDNERLIKSTQETEQAALNMSASWEKAWTAIEGATTSAIYGKIIPYLTNLVNIIADLFSGQFKEAFDLWRHTGETPTTAQTIPIASGNAPLGIRSNNPGNLQPGGRETVFPTLQAGIAAEQTQLQRYGTRGINTLAKIASTWPDKAHQASWLAALQKATGYDINQPLDLNDPAVNAKVAKGINVAEGDAIANSAFAAHSAVSTADASPLNSSVNAGSNSNNSVSIGTINVHTQATDADGIANDINAALNKHINATISNWDDGVAK